MKQKASKHMVELGKGALIDDGVTLGYSPSRGLNSSLVIGSGARIRCGTVIYSGSRIGRNLETGHNAIIREENIIGDDFSIWGNSIIDYGCKIGNNVKIHSGVYIGQFTTMEDDVFIGPGVTMANDIHPGCPSAYECMQGPHIKRGAQVGVNCCVLPKVTIGEYSIIGAGSVVTKDIPDGVIAYGNPARAVCGIEDITCSSGLRDKPYSHLIGRLRNANTIG
jgi:acetyltransferase-like isoleucine patch superfamily enzyme